MDSVTLTNVLLAVVGFCVVYILKGIKDEIQGVKADVHLLGTDLRASISDIYGKITDDRERLVAVETFCRTQHDLAPQSRDRRE